MSGAGANVGAVIDRMFAALAAGDLAGAQACLGADARIWHSYDGAVYDRDTIMAGWQWLRDNFSRRAFSDVRRQPTPTGFVQQQVMDVTTLDGERKAWPVCLLVRLDAGGLIARIDEYIDRAGTFVPADDGPALAPGL